MVLDQFKPSGLTVKIFTTPSGGSGDFLYTEDPNWDDFMSELLLAAIKKLADEKNEYLLEFFIDNFEVSNFNDILNMDIDEILKRIEKPHIYDINSDGSCIGCGYGMITHIFDEFYQYGIFNERYLKYSVYESHIGITIGYLKIVE